TLTWTADPDAEHYVVETSGAIDFEVTRLLISATPSVTIPFRLLPQNSLSPLYWRVRALRDGLEGSSSAVRSFVPQRYVPGALRLASGALAFVETTAPGGGPACDGPD